MTEPHHRSSLECLCSSPNRPLHIPLQKFSQIFPTHFDCDNQVKNFTYGKNCKVFDTGQWQLRLSTPLGTVGAFERRYPKYARNFLLWPQYSYVTHRISGNILHVAIISSTELLCTTVMWTTTTVVAKMAIALQLTGLSCAIICVGGLN